MVIQSNTNYDFVYVDQEIFEKYTPKSFEDLFKVFCEYKSRT